MIAAGVRFDHTCVDGEALASNQAGVHAGPHHVLEDTTEKIAFAKEPMPVLREGRMIGNRAIEAETAEPAIGEIEIDLLAQTTLGTDAETISDKHIRIINSGSIEGRPVEE